MYFNNNTGLLLDLEKKLKAYDKDYNYKKEYSFNDIQSSDFVAILLNLSSQNIEEKINQFNQKYLKEKETYYHLILKNNKIFYLTNNLDSIASELFNTLYHQDFKESFIVFVNLLRKTLKDDGQEHWFTMSFKNDEIKNYFLDEATKYIIKNKGTQESFIHKLNNTNIQDDYRFNNLNIESIPKKFNNLFEMYQWLNIQNANNYVHQLSSNFTQSLLGEIIDNKDTTLEYHKHHKRIGRILDKCSKDCFIIGEIFKSFHINIKLNIYLLSSPKYTQFALLNILKNNEKINLQDNHEFDYAKEWQELINRQSINIYFQHYSNHYFEKESVFNILNHLAYYAFKYQNQNQYTIALDYFLIKLKTFHIQGYQKKEYFFNEIVEMLIEQQSLLIKANDTLDMKDYFLMSWYLKELNQKEKILNENHSKLILKIINSIELSFNRYFLNSLKKNNFYIQDEYLERVDFYLFYNLSTNKTNWLKVINIQKVKALINKENRFNILKIVKFHFKILLNIFKNNLEDKELSRYIIDLAIAFGVEENYGLLYSSQKDDFLYDFLEILNHIDENLFNSFLEVFMKKATIKEALQIYTYTLLEVRKNKIYSYIEPLLNEKHSFFWLPDLDTTIQLASYHELDNLVNKLINTYKEYSVAEGGRDKDFSELKDIIYRNDILNIYRDNNLSLDDKLRKLNFEEKNKTPNCTSYETFIRALIFYETKPINTYNLLSNLFQNQNHALYLFNMLSAYFKAYIDDDYKIEKYTHILNTYDEHIEKFIQEDNSLFGYQVLIHGYSEIGNNSKLIHLYDKVPNYYKDSVKKGLPDTLNIFDSQAYIGNKLIICVEGKHDINFLKNINNNIPELKEIINLETTDIPFMDLKGGNLQAFVKEHNLSGSNIIELHIYDSDKGSRKNENKYHKECEEVKKRDDASFCFLTQKRELENYIPASLIEQEFSIDVSTIQDWNTEDIPTFIKNKTSYKNEKPIKCILNGKLSQTITKEHLEELNAFNEIKSWFEKMKELHEK